LGTIKGQKMIISDKYGPQYDHTDGTIGKIQLAKRWVIVNENGDLVTARQGRFTYQSQQEAESMIVAYWANNSKETVWRHLGKELYAEAWWCYPNHFDPIGPVNPKPVSF
jgi:hypothetical protein